MSDEDRYQKALAAVQDEVLRVIGRRDIPADVRRSLDIIESICRHGVDIRTTEEKGQRAAVFVDADTLTGE